MFLAMIVIGNILLKIHVPKQLAIVIATVGTMATAYEILLNWFT